MGSVGVIISSLLIENFGWNIADPICSLFIATMILLSVMPLLKETSVILLLRTPVKIERDLATACRKLLTVDGVLSYREPKIWCHTADKVFGSIHIQAAPDASEQKMVAQVSSIFKEIGVANMTVQVEKESYFCHLSGLGANEMVQMTNNFKTQPLSLEDSFIKSI